MKENIEEDIKVAEKLIRTMEQDIVTFKDNKTKEIYEFFIKSLQNILSDYKRLQEEFKQVDHECERLEQKEVRLEKENEELKKELGRVTNGRNQLFEYATAQQSNPEMLHKILRVEYVSKQKIQDKIEELENKSGGNVFHIQQTINAEIRLLQDLLESEEK